MEETSNLTSIHCPVCDNLCSIQVASCPKCGHPFSQNSEIKPESGNRNKSFYEWIVFGILLGVIVIGIVGFAFYNLSGFLKTKHSSPELERKLCDYVIDGDFEKVKNLVESGVNVNTNVYQSANPLTLAILYAAPSKMEDSPSDSKRFLRLQMVRYLLDNGANVNKGNPKQSPLAIARIIDDDANLEEMLIKAGANPNTENEEGTSKSNPKKVNASLMKLIYYVEVSSASEKQSADEKRKIIEGGK